MQPIRMVFEPGSPITPPAHPLGLLQIHRMGNNFSSYCCTLLFNRVAIFTFWLYKQTWTVCYFNNRDTDTGRRHCKGDDTCRTKRFDIIDKKYIKMNHRQDSKSDPLFSETIRCMLFSNNRWMTICELRGKVTAIQKWTK